MRGEDALMRSMLDAPVVCVMTACRVKIAALSSTVGASPLAQPVAQILVASQVATGHHIGPVEGAAAVAGQGAAERVIDGPPRKPAKFDLVCAKMKRKPHVSRISKRSRPAMQPVVRHVDKVRMPAGWSDRDHKGRLAVERDIVIRRVAHV